MLVVYTGSEGWLYTGSGLSVTCMQMYEHVRWWGYVPAVEFPEQSRNFARIHVNSHAFQEFRSLSRRISHVRGISLSPRKFPRRNFECHWYSGKNFMLSGKFASIPGILNALKEICKHLGNLANSIYHWHLKNFACFRVVLSAFLKFR
jgi:hypothetical protein